MKKIKLYLLIAFLLLPSTSIYAVSSDEYSIKAAFLVKFFDYVSWKVDLRTDVSLFITVFGDDPFEEKLDEYVSKSSLISKTKMKVLRTDDLQGLKNEQIVFSNENNPKKIAELLEYAKNKNILLVGEGEQFAKLGGTIAFIIKNNKIRFVINLKSAQKAGIKISSKLLRLAKVIR